MNGKKRVQPYADIQHCDQVFSVSSYTDLNKKDTNNNSILSSVGVEEVKCVYIRPGGSYSG